MKNKAQYLVTSTPITSGASMKEEILHMMGVGTYYVIVVGYFNVGGGAFGKKPFFLRFVLREPRAKKSTFY